MPSREEAARALGVTPVQQRLGRYELRYRVAQGGMGAVFLARLHASAGFAKWMAVKTIHAHVQDDPRFVTMFLDEARLVAQLEHPNVCRVTDFGDCDGSWFLAMEYLHGEPLSAVIVRALEGSQGAAGPRGLPLGVAVRMVADAARGLHHAHELIGPDGLPAHVVHRDVSPHNIFALYDGVAKVLDFGIAQSRARLAEQTSEGELRGKLAYMSPQQLRREPVDRRADVWALGVVLWEATVGQRLFKGSNAGDTVLAILQGARAPSDVVPDYPPALEAIVLRALAPEPDQRYPTADALARDLERWLVSSGALVGHAEVGEYLRALFADRKQLREALLRDVDTAERALPAPAAATAAPTEATATTVDEAPTRVGGKRPSEAASVHGAMGSVSAASLALAEETLTPATRRAPTRRGAGVLGLALGVFAAALVAGWTLRALAPAPHAPALPASAAPSARAAASAPASAGTAALGASATALASASALVVAAPSGAPASAAPSEPSTAPSARATASAATARGHGASRARGVEAPRASASATVAAQPTSAPARRSLGDELDAFRQPGAPR